MSAQRKLGIQMCRFMLQMMQVPLYPKPSKGQQSDEMVLESSQIPSLECTEEGLAIRIAVEVVQFLQMKIIVCVPASLIHMHILGLCIHVEEK